MYLSKESFYYNILQNHNQPNVWCLMKNIERFLIDYIYAIKWFYTYHEIICSARLCSLLNQGSREQGTHHVDNLLEGESKGELDGLWLVDDRALQLVVVGKEVVQQSPLVHTTLCSCNFKSVMLQEFKILELLLLLLLQLVVDGQEFVHSQKYF